jgi:hypothetical protein
MFKKIPNFFTYHHWKSTGLESVRDQVTLLQLLLLLLLMIMILIKGGETSKNSNYIMVMMKIIKK